MKLMRSLVLGCALGVVALLVPTPAVAAPPDPSAATANTPEVAPGGTFTVSVELFNPQAFTVTGANAQLRTVEAPITSVFELVSCTGGACFEYSPTSYRAVVGDIAPGAGATVVFTFRARDAAPFGAYTLEHQFVGGNFSFGPGFGPVVSVVGSPQVADVGVALNASASGLLVSRITYTVSVVNHGPAAATAVRIGGSYPAGLSWASASGCARDGSHGVVCDFPSIASGGSASATFSVNAGLLTLGSFTTTVNRVSSAPSDPDSGNDSARRSCTALTSLIVRC